MRGRSRWRDYSEDPVSMWSPLECSRCGVTRLRFRMPVEGCPGAGLCEEVLICDNAYQSRPGTLGG